SYPSGLAVASSSKWEGERASNFGYRPSSGSLSHVAPGRPTRMSHYGRRRPAKYVGTVRAAGLISTVETRHLPNTLATRVDLRPLIYDYRAAKGRMHDDATGASGRRPRLVPRFRYEGSVWILACALS